MAHHSLNVFLDYLRSQGEYTFSTDDYCQYSKKSLIAVRAAIRRAGERGQIATPYRGFHVIVPPEYTAIGCLPAERFIAKLMSYLNEPYYIGLLTAAAYYGAAHHAPQEFQVVVKKGRPKLQAGKVKITFIARKDLEKMSVAERKTSDGMIRVSSPELTAFDLVVYSHHCGGLDNVATVLAELAVSINSGKLRDLAETIGSIRWSQRLGYLLDKVNAKSKAYGLASLVETYSPPLTKLEPKLPSKGLRNKKWKLIANVEVEPDL